MNVILSTRSRSVPKTGRRGSPSAAPDLGEGYGALGVVLEDRLEFESARKAFDSSQALAGGSASVWRNYSEFYAAMGFADEAVTTTRRAVTLDPLNALSHCRLGDTFQRRSVHGSRCTAAAHLVTARGSPCVVSVIRSSRSLYLMTPLCRTCRHPGVRANV
jgi:hypothetical protein